MTDASDTAVLLREANGAIIETASPRNVLGVFSDREAVEQFLLEVAANRSAHTLRAYERELARFLRWLVGEGLSLRAVTRRHWIAYRAHLSEVTQMSPASLEYALRLVGRFFAYATAGGFLEANPAAVYALTRRRQQRTQRALKFFDDAQWAALWEVLHERSARSWEGARERWAVAVVYYLGLRVSEVASHVMGDFFRRGEHWLFHVEGKGDKEVLLPVPPALREELVRWRRACALPEEPLPGEHTPLVPRRDLAGSLLERRLRDLFKDVVQEAARRLETRDAQAAALMRRGSIHWLRHTYVTHLRRRVQHRAVLLSLTRHASADTQDIYDHAVQSELHAAVQCLPPIPAAAASTSEVADEHGIAQ